MRVTDDAGRVYPLMMVALAGVYFLVYSWLSVHRYNKFLCGAWDLGLFETLFRNILSGAGYKTFWGPFDHFEPTLVVFLPFYAVFRDARVLLVLQSAALAAAVWPLYLLARQVSGKRAIAGAVGIAYLLYPLLGCANLYDFHNLCLSPFFFFWMLYWMVKRRWGLYALFTLFVLMVRESEAILVLGVGLYLLSRKDWLPGALTIAASFAWGYLAVYVLLPWISGAKFWQAHRYQGLMSAASWGVLTREGRLRALGYVLQCIAVAVFVLAPTGFLVLRRLRAALFIVGPMYAANVVSQAAFQRVLLGHYGITAASATLGAAALATAGMKGFAEGEKPSRWPIFLVIVAVLSNIVLSYPATERWAYPQQPADAAPAAYLRLNAAWNVLSLPIPFTSERAAFYRSTPDEEAFRAMVPYFPKDAIIAAQNNLGYQLAGRYRLRDITATVTADYYLFRPVSADIQAARAVTDPLMNRLRGEPGMRCFLLMNESGGKVPELAFYAAGDKALEFYENVRRASEQDGGNAALRRALAAMEKTMGLGAPR